MNTALRLLWLLLTALGLGLFLAFTPDYLEAHRTPFTGSELRSTQNSLLRPAEMQALQEIGVSPSFYAGYLYTFELLWRALWCAPAALIFWRKSDDRMGRLVAFMLMTTGLFSTTLPSINLAYNYRGLRLLMAAPVLVNPALLVFFAYLFPNGRFVPRWTRWPAALSGALLTGLYALVLVMPSRLESVGPIVLLVGLFAGSVAVALLIQTYRYRRASTPVERQQTRWVLLGFLGFLAISLLGIVYAALDPSVVLGAGPRPVLFLMGLYAAVFFAFGSIPLTISFAILRYRLWDVDLIIRRTLTYGAVTATLALLYFGSVISLQAAFRRLTGQGDQLAIVASTLGIAALFGPVRRRIQNGIDRRFYRSKYDAEKVLAAFGTTVREEVDLERLTTKLLAAVQETMQPAHVSLWLRPTADYGPQTLDRTGPNSAA